MTSGKIPTTPGGFTVVETLIATVLIMIIMLGTTQYFTMSRIGIERESRTNLARNQMAEQLEYALALPYPSLTDSLTEDAVPLLVGNLLGYRTTSVAEVDDDLDGLSPADTTVPDYKQVTVFWSWSNPLMSDDSLSVIITPDRGFRQ